MYDGYPTSYCQSAIKTLCQGKENFFNNVTFSKFRLKSDLQSQFDALVEYVKQGRSFQPQAPTVFQKFRGTLNAMKEAVKQKFESRNEQTPQGQSVR